MPFVVAALMLLGAVTALNLLLTLAVIRRVRMQAGQPGRPDEPGGQARPGFSPSVGVVVGAPAPGFAATDLDGVPVRSGGHEDGLSLYAFFGADCRGCWDRLPDFLRYAETSGLPAERLVAVVVGDAPRGAEMAERMRAAGVRVVHEPEGGSMSSAFGVTGFPTFVLVDRRGLVEDAVFGLADLPLPVVA